MTTTVYVKARAHGAILTLKNVEPGAPIPDSNGETWHEGHVLREDESALGAWQEREIHLEPNQRLVVREGSPGLIAHLAAQAEVTDSQEITGDDTAPAAEVIDPIPDTLHDETNHRGRRR